MKNVTKFVNNGRADCVVKIETVEKKYNAKYVGQLCLKTKDGSWAESPAEIFWQPTPPAGYSNYLGLIIQGGTLYITSGAAAVEPVISGAIAADGEIIYSRYRHDYRTSKDGTIWIDGGRDYTRGGIGQYIQLKIVNGEWFQLEDGDMVDGKTLVKGDFV
tara:strand:- start:8 stop:487 length:480 start_codon:yes stop_codon:yes gene_type:complete